MRYIKIFFILLIPFILTACFIPERRLYFSWNRPAEQKDPCNYEFNVSSNMNLIETERGMMIMTDEEMIENLKCVIADISAQCKQLEAENAALRERLEKAVELTEPHWELCPYSGMYIVYYKAIVPKSEAYDDRAAAESRLAELKGERE